MRKTKKYQTTNSTAMNFTTTVFKQKLAVGTLLVMVLAIVTVSMSVVQAHSESESDEAMYFEVNSGFPSLIEDPLTAPSTSSPSTTKSASHSLTPPTPRRMIDAHSHYSLIDSQHLSPAQIITILDQNQIAKVLITGTPNSGTQALYDYAPERIVPFLSVYRSKADKNTWMHRMAVLDEAKRALETGTYHGIGELHIFAQDRDSEVLKGLVLLAKQYQIPLLIHGDAQIIDTIFEVDPKARVLWAHLGTVPEIPLLQSMLDKYPEQLFIDTSVRDKQLLASGQLHPQWREFFVHNANRLMVAIDTFSLNRWQNYDRVVSDIYRWLQDLPEEVAQKIAYDNANDFFTQTKTTAKTSSEAVLTGR